MQRIKLRGNRHCLRQVRCAHHLSRSKDEGSSLRFPDPHDHCCKTLHRSTLAESGHGHDGEDSARKLLSYQDCIKIAAKR